MRLEETLSEAQGFPSRRATFGTDKAGQADGRGEIEPSQPLLGSDDLPEQLIVRSGPLHDRQVALHAPDEKPVPGVAHVAFVAARPLAGQRVHVVAPFQLRYGFGGVLEDEGDDGFQRLVVHMFLVKALEVAFGERRLRYRPARRIVKNRVVFTLIRLCLLFPCLRAGRQYDVMQVVLCAAQRIKARFGK